MLIDIAPLIKYPDFRLLFIGQMISYLGTMVSYMAVPYQVYHLTKSNALVGALGIAQLGPVLISVYSAGLTPTASIAASCC